MPADVCLNKQICDCDAILDWMSKTTHALPVPDSRESDFTGTNSRTAFTRHRNEFSLWYSYRGELSPV